LKVNIPAKLEALDRVHFDWFTMILESSAIMILNTRNGRVSKGRPSQTGTEVMVQSKPSTWGDPSTTTIR
jgi:hypothetical protein